MIVLQTLYALLAIIEDTVHALRATQETLTKEDVPRYLKSYLMLAVRKIENVRASMLVSLKMDMELVEIHVSSMSHVPEMLSVKSMTNFLFVS